MGFPSSSVNERLNFFWLEIFAETSLLFSISARELFLGTAGCPFDIVILPGLIFALSKTFIEKDLSKQYITELVIKIIIKIINKLI